MKTVIIVGVVLAVVAILIAAGIDNYKKKMALRDTRRRFIETYEFPSILRTKVQRHYPALNAEQIGMILEGLRQWFLLIGNYPGKRFGMPSKAVDTAWHEFILMTRDYDAFCKQAFGEYLHHSPNSGGENAERERDALAQTYALAPIASMSMTGLVAGAAVGIGLFNLDHALGIEGGHHYTDAELSELTQRHAAMASSGGESGVGVSVDGSGRDNHSGHGIDGGGDSGGGDGGGCGGGCGS
jgi:uncharacterized membrane protein YgcG